MPKRVETLKQVRKMAQAQMDQPGSNRVWEAIYRLANDALRGGGK